MNYSSVTSGWADAIVQMKESGIVVHLIFILTIYDVLILGITDSESTRGIISDATHSGQFSCYNNETNEREFAEFEIFCDDAFRSHSQLILILFLSLLSRPFYTSSWLLSITE